MSGNQSLYPVTYSVVEGIVHIGGVSVKELVETYGTPLMVFDEATVRNICQEYTKAFQSRYQESQILFAAKAFMTSAICKILESEKVGIDVVSDGEIHTAYHANFPMEHIFFNGNNKSLAELEYALDLGVGFITVDNFQEIELLGNLTGQQNHLVNILLRVTPGIECHTHEYIQTGHLDSKFGFDINQIEQAVSLIKTQYPCLNLVGLHGHIGSQIFETAIYGDLVGILLEQFKVIQEKFDIELTHLNLGGGLGIKYTDDDDPPEINDIAEIIVNSLYKKTEEYDLKHPKLFVEPGRSIIGTAGVTLYKVGSSKKVPKGRQYVAVDGGMADNIRPSLYQAKYTMQVANKVDDSKTEIVTIAGRYCESGDILIKDIELPQMVPGDIVAVYSTGAYNYSMASNYNRVCRPEVVLVYNGITDTIIRRETLDDIVHLDKIPQRLKNLTEVNVNI